MLKNPWQTALWTPLVKIVRLKTRMHPGSIPFEYSLHVAALQPTDEQRETEKILLDKVENMDIWKEQEGQTEEKDIVFIRNRIRSDLQRISRARKFDVNKPLN